MVNDLINQIQEIASYSYEYDRSTIEICREIERRYDRSNDRDKKLGAFRKIELYFTKGERYRLKEETIRKRKDELDNQNAKLEAAQPTSNPICLVCQNPMEMIDKEIPSFDKKIRVLFIFICNVCHKGRGFYDDGEEYRRSPPTCTKCNTPVDEKKTKKGNKFIWSYACINCGYRGNDIIDFDERSEIPIMDKAFPIDREKYCMSREDGEQYLSHLFNMKSLKEIEGQNKGENAVINRAVRKIKILTIAQVEELLRPLFTENNFKSLELGKPEMYKGSMKINYNAQDTVVKRKPWDKQHLLEFKKLLEETLGETNWRPMSDGIRYTLGLLEGTIRGVSIEDDLKEMARIRLKKAGKLTVS